MRGRARPAVRTRSRLSLPLGPPWRRRFFPRPRRKNCSCVAEVRQWSVMAWHIPSTALTGPRCKAKFTTACLTMRAVSRRMLQLGQCAPFCPEERREG
ncbi:Hypothetical predicted protein [Podarcis lilfordi]|uniref:Uncharacterized protein n=1 Tax=Podarcis lilfordi TaxID=74358 RepID=A0AA35K0C4_9SAUR|nr:Hypothetical predicted protein [Podarcis lilfordi]